MADKPRSIFEEVGTTEKQVATPGAIDRGVNDGRGAIRIWLFALFALVFLMIVVGGLTRLTDSGLSITEWKPVTGAMPPLSAEAWDAEFEKYKQIPEYIEQNAGMSLAEFKVIYWWEWGHRQLGRVIGLVWAAGFVYFAVRRQIPTGWTGKLLLLGALGGLQGFIGWWMVSSGLEDGMLDVASYRLATHLGLAFVIFGFLTWFILQLSRREADLMQARRSGDARLARLATVLIAISFLQIIWGAMVAGIDAGRSYAEWPLMGGTFVPSTAFDLQPFWTNFFENAGLVQFIHRMIGYVLLAFGIFVWWQARSSGNSSIRYSFNLVLAIFLLQMTLGIVTVLYAAPWSIAIVHQIGAIVLWVIVLRAKFMTRHPFPEKIAGA